MPTATASSGRARVSYRCSRCGEPKRGHQCIFEQRLLAAAAAVAANAAATASDTPTAALVAAAIARPAVAMADAAAQVEMDEDMTVRALLC